MGRSFSRLRRLRQITSVVARHGLGHYLDRRRAHAQRKRSHLGYASSLEGEGRDPWNDADAMLARAQRFRHVLEDLGPTFIKFGQILSTRADVLPPRFAEALSDLQDHCAPMPMDHVSRVVEAGLAAPIAALFKTFDEVPLASASIAQVHRAVTLAGDEVAVKVQRPNIRDSILEDLDLLRVLAQLIEKMIQESGMLAPQDMLEEFERAFINELDFTHEAFMMQRFRLHLQDSQSKARKAGRQLGRHYVVPAVVESLSCRTVLTMEFMRGSRLIDLGPQHDRKRIAAHMIASAFEQVFVDGLFHADPHPGNFLVLNDGRLALLDFGCVGMISYAMRETLMVLVLSVVLRDAYGVARLLYRVGIQEERVSLQRLRDACDSLFSRYLHDRATLAHVPSAKLLKELFDLAAQFRVRIPSEYALVARASVTLEGVIRQLDPSLEILTMAKPMIRWLVEERLKWPGRGKPWGQGALKTLLRTRTYLKDLPTSLSQVLLDLEEGKLHLNVDNPRLDTLARNIDTLGLVIFMGLVAGGLITGALGMLGRYDVRVWGLPVVPTVALYVASMLFGTALGRYFLAPRLRKLSISRWRGSKRFW